MKRVCFLGVVAAIATMMPLHSTASNAASQHNGAVMMDGSPLLEVEGSMQHYTMLYVAGNPDSDKVETNMSDIHFELCLDMDGTSLYLRTLLPGYNGADDNVEGSWVEAEFDEDELAEEVIIIPAGQQLCTYHDEASGCDVVLCLEFGAVSSPNAVSSKSSDYDPIEGEDGGNGGWFDFGWGYGNDEVVDVNTLSYQKEFKLILGNTGNISVHPDCSDWYVVAYGFCDNNKDLEGVYAYGYDYRFHLSRGDGNGFGDDTSTDEDSNDDNLGAISDTSADQYADAPTKFYSLSGVELPANNLPKGIVVRIQGHNVTKMVVK
jgi:hypothetical protein